MSLTNTFYLFRLASENCFRTLGTQAGQTHTFRLRCSENSLHIYLYICIYTLRCVGIVPNFAAIVIKDQIRRMSRHEKEN